MRRALDQSEADGTCKKLKRDGRKCRGMAMEGSRYCFFHNPAAKNARTAAQQRGGRVNRAAVLPADTADVRLESSGDIAILLAETINQVRKGKVAPKVASTIGYLASSLTKVMEATKFEERLAMVERAIAARTPEPALFNPDEIGEINGNSQKPPEA